MLVAERKDREIIGVFRSLFKKSHHSYVRAWVSRRMKEFKKSQEMSLENLFAAWLCGVSSFGEPLPVVDNRESDTVGQMLKFVDEHYSGDASLFEVGCYIYFRTDLWLCANWPKYRDEVCSSFRQQFNDLFSRALNLRDMPDLFAERIETYVELARESEDAERHHFYLLELIKRTKDNMLPKHYHFDHEPTMLEDFYVETALKIRLAAFERGMIPACLKTVATYALGRQSGQF